MCLYGIFSIFLHSFCVDAAMGIMGESADNIRTTSAPAFIHFTNTCGSAIYAYMVCIYCLCATEQLPAKHPSLL